MFYLKQKLKAISTIIKSFILNYYNSNININIIIVNFNQIYNFIQNYFKGVEYKQTVFLNKIN